jgi:four helix bundle protein
MRPILERPAFRRELDLHAQTERAAESPCPNIAEGFGRFLPRDNCRFVRIAASSLNELLNHLDRAEAKRLISATERVALSALTERALSVTVGYAAYLQDAKPPRSRRRPGRRPNDERGTLNDEPERGTSNEER